MTTRTTVATETVIADICLYGNTNTGAGWLARSADGRMFGTGEPARDRSFTEAVWTAADTILAAGARVDVVRIFAPGGLRVATVPIGAIPGFGALPWEPAPVYVLEVGK
jgi:hypothetical protein